jgi:hypothetical protein
VVVRGADVDQALGAFAFTHDVIEENPPHAHNGFMKIAYVLEGSTTSGSVTPPSPAAREHTQGLPGDEGLPWRGSGRPGEPADFREVAADLAWPEPA